MTARKDTRPHGFEPAETGLRGQVVRGGAAVTSFSVLDRLVQFGMTAWLARLLTPEEFGTFAMTLVVVGVLQQPLAVAIPSAIVQRKGLEHGQISTMFWMNTAGSVLASGVLFAVAPLVALFFEDPLLADTTRACAPWPIVGALGAQHAALLQRRMQFLQLSAYRLGAVIAGGAAAIAMAYSHMGVFSLAGRFVAEAGVLAVLVWTATRWVPGPVTRGAGVRAMTSFSGYLSTNLVLSALASNAYRIVLGRWAGAAALGVFSKSLGVARLSAGAIASPMRHVVVSGLARVSDDGERLDRAFLRVIGVVALVSMPFAAFLFVATHEVVAIALGDQWDAAVPVLRVLAPAAVLLLVNQSFAWVLVATGRGRERLALGAISATALLLGALPAAWYGPLGAAWGFAAATILVDFPARAAFAARAVGIGIDRVLVAVAGPIAAAACMCGAIAGADSLLSLDQAHVVVALAAKAAIGAVAFLVAARLFAPGATREAWNAWTTLRDDQRRPSETA